MDSWKPILIANRHSNQVTRSDSVELLISQSGSPIVPTKNDQVTVNGVLYTVSHRHWNVDEGTITVYASRRDD
jgi:hypothetical protein